MAKRIPINRLFSKAIGLSADRISGEFGAPFRSLRLSVGKPNVFFDGRPKLNLGNRSEGKRLLRGQFTHIGQIRNNYGRTQTGLARFMAAITIALGGARLADKAEGYLDRALDWLDDEIHLQILPDGGHVSRSPEKAQKVLEALLTLDNILEARGIARSKAMGRAIDRLRPIMPFFSSGGGGLVSFNGGGEGDAKRFAKLLKHLNVTSRPFGCTL